MNVKPRTALVEGTTDSDLFDLADRLESEATGTHLLNHECAIVAAGVGDAGGAKGIVRELIGLRALAKTYLLPDGRPKYRFVALFDGDPPGKHAIREAHELDSSILEFKD